MTFLEISFEHIRIDSNNLILILVNFVSKLGPNMVRYDFLLARRVILSNVRTESD